MKIKYMGGFKTEVRHESGAVIQTDAPKDNFGSGELFSPTDLFAASLGSCALTLIAIAAKKLRIDLGTLSAEVEKEMAQTPKRRIGKIVVRIRSSFFPNSEQQKVLEQAAIDCPVHLSLHKNVSVELDFIWGL